MGKWWYSAAISIWRSASHTGTSVPEERPRYVLYRMLGGPAPERVWTLLLLSGTVAVPTELSGPQIITVSMLRILRATLLSMKPFNTAILTHDDGHIGRNELFDVMWINL
jgi:hypothetical protein